MTVAPCRVKIIKCSHPQRWYSNLIGHEFDVDNAPPHKDYVLWEDYDHPNSRSIMWRHIPQEDCEKIIKK